MQKILGFKKWRSLEDIWPLTGFWIASVIEGFYGHLVPTNARRLVVRKMK